MSDNPAREPLHVPGADGVDSAMLAQAVAALQAQQAAQPGQQQVTDAAQTSAAQSEATRKQIQGALLKA